MISIDLINKRKVIEKQFADQAGDQKDLIWIGGLKPLLNVFASSEEENPWIHGDSDLRPNA